MVRADYISLVFFIFMLVFFSSCRKIYEPIEVHGRVVDVDSSQPIAEAKVSIISPEDIAAETFSNENGEYLFEEVNVDSIIDIVIFATKEGYNTDSIQLLAAPEKPLTVPAIRLKNLNGTDPLDPGGPGSGGSASITLQSKSRDFIQVRGTGGVETVDLEFIVRDSSGVQIGNNNPVYVHFNITSGPNDGESIYPDSVLTSGGIAKATLTSGYSAGVVQVRASFNRNGITSHSSPVPVTISGGLPNNNHFEVDYEYDNIPAHSSTPNTITVLLGDKHGNPVIPGTAVLFNTNKGVINGSVNTDDQGNASSELRTNNTSPGMATVKIETVDDTNTKISREIDVLFSGKPQLSVTPEIIDISSFRTQVFSVQLSDEMNNPLGPGTTFQVSADNGDLILTGHTSAELEDTQSKGAGYTEFEFQLRKPDNIAVTEDVTLTLTSTGPNGTVTRELLFPVDEVEPGIPGSIYVESLTETDIGVRSTGQKEDTQITFQVVDVQGNPLNNQNAVDVNFTFGNQPNGGEFLSPSSTTTNHLGQATVSLTSGTAAGTVQIVAETTDNTGRVIRSIPVQVVIHAGLADPGVFSLVTITRNTHATAYGHTVSTTALAGDRHGNTVPDGTAVHFATDGGFIQGSAFTQDGRATSELTVANPYPPGGIATISATTADHNQLIVEATARVIFSLDPIINVNPTSINLPNGGEQTFYFEVSDINAHPMVGGTSISVNVEGTDFEIIGDTDVTLRDINSSFSNIPDLTQFSFTIRDSNHDEINDTPIIITIEVDGPNGYAKRVISGRKEKAP